jgi:hypothetical protein
MPPVGFEPAIPTIERPQTHALDRAATGIGRSKHVAYCKASNLFYQPSAVLDQMYILWSYVTGRFQKSNAGEALRFSELVQQHIVRGNIRLAFGLMTKTNESMELSPDATCAVECKSSVLLIQITVQYVTTVCLKQQVEMSNRLPNLLIASSSHVEKMPIINSVFCLPFVSRCGRHSRCAGWVRHIRIPQISYVT